jgi:hypothetical protein
MWMGAQWMLAMGQALATEPQASLVEKEVDEPKPYQNTFSVGVGTAGLIRERSEVVEIMGPDLLAWNARYAWAPVHALAWEFGYSGGTDTMAERRNPLMVTLLETDVKLNLLPRAPLVPFVAGGLGYGLFSWKDRRISTMTVPLAGGLDVVIDYLVLEGRTTVRPKMFGPLETRGAYQDWMLEANIGSQF